MLYFGLIIKDTDNSLEFNLKIPINASEVPSLPGKYYEVLVPADTMTVKKFPAYLYGLKNLESFLDDNVHKLSHSKKIIKPKESTAFYFYNTLFD